MRIPIAEHHKDQLLSTLMYHMPMDMRSKLIHEAPAAYNAYTLAQGYGIDPAGPVKVVRSLDGSEIN